MEKFLFLILCSSLYSIRATDCDPDLPPCSDVHDIATIKCGTPLVGQEGVLDSCTITCGADGEVACSDKIAGLLGQDPNKIEHTDAGICKEKCREQAKAAAGDPECEFYRWEEKGEGSKCILQTVCEPDIRCQPDEPNHSCMTGQIGCTEDGATACSLGSPVEYHHEKFHLICHGDLDSPGDINIYSNDAIAEIDTGTVCYTIHMCDKWEDIVDDGDTYYRKLAVFCAEDGTWKPMTETGNADNSTALINVDNEGLSTLLEPTCPSECALLSLDAGKITEEGTELICEEGLVDDHILDNGNSCILICDNHFAMSISCQFEYDGSKKWKDENRVEVSAEKVHC